MNRPPSGEVGGECAHRKEGKGEIERKRIEEFLRGPPRRAGFESRQNFQKFEKKSKFWQSS